MELGASATFHQYRTLKNPPKPMTSVSTANTQPIAQQAEDLKRVADSFNAAPVTAAPIAAAAVPTPATQPVQSEPLVSTETIEAPLAQTIETQSVTPEAVAQTATVAEVPTGTPAETATQNFASVAPTPPVIEKLDAEEVQNHAPIFEADSAIETAAPVVAEKAVSLESNDSVSTEASSVQAEADLPQAYELAMMTLNAMDGKSEETPASAPAATAADIAKGFEGAKASSSTIDQKIDEAIALAERIKSSSENESDELDIPAFIRNGVMDLPDTP